MTSPRISRAATYTRMSGVSAPWTGHRIRCFESGFHNMEVRGIALDGLGGHVDATTFTASNGIHVLPIAQSGADCTSK